MVKCDAVTDGMSIHKNFSPLIGGHGHHRIVMVHHRGMLGLDTESVKRYMTYPTLIECFCNTSPQSTEQDEGFLFILLSVLFAPQHTVPFLQQVHHYMSQLRIFMEVPEVRRIFLKLLSPLFSLFLLLQRTATWPEQ